MKLQLKRGQISIEYLLIIGFAIAVVGPMALFAANFVGNHQQEVQGQKLYSIGTTVVAAAQNVYYQGDPAKRTLTVSLPQKLESADVYAQEIVFRYKTNAGIDSVTVPSPVNLTGTFPTQAGKHKIEIVAQSNSVSIDKVT